MVMANDQCQNSRPLENTNVGDTITAFFLVIPDIHIEKLQDYKPYKTIGNVSFLIPSRTCMEVLESSHFTCMSLKCVRKPGDGRKPRLKRGKHANTTQTQTETGKELCDPLSVKQQC